MGGSSSKIYVSNDSDIVENNKSSDNDLINPLIPTNDKIDDNYITKLINSEKWETLNKLLLKFPNKLLEPRGTLKQLPIHIAILKGAPNSFIIELIDKCPESLIIPDSESYLPLHRSIIHRCHIDVIKKLLLTNNKAAEISDNDGLLPLHHSIIHKSNYQIFLLLLDANEKGIYKKSKYGKLSIHLSIEYHSPIEIVKTLLEKYPLSSREFNDAKLPLHYVCEKKSTNEIFNLVLSYYPEAANTKGYDGMLPLHFATANRASLHIIIQLVDLYRDGVLVYDKTSRLPIHYALEKQSSEEVIEFLLDVAPNTASSQGPKGERPLHIALHKNLSIKVISILLSLDDYALKETDSSGMLPIQHVLTNNASDEVVLAILKASPQSTKISDEYQRLPIHYATSRNASYQVIKEIISIYPEGLLIGDQNNQLPIHLILKRNPTVELIELLLSYYKESLIHADIYEYLPIFYAIENKFCTIKIFEAMFYSNINIEINRKCCSYRSKGKLSLHYAIIYKKSYDIIKLLVTIYPDALTDREPQYGKLPVCLALEKQLSKEIVLILISKDNVILTDNEGYLPIHYGIKYLCSKDVIKYMLELYPNIVFVIDNPIHNKIYNTSSRRRDSAIGNTVDFHKIDLSSNNGSEYEDTLLLSESKGQKALHTSLIAYGKRKRELTGRLLIHYIIEDLIGKDGLVISSDVLVEIVLLTMPLSYQTGILNPNHYYVWTYLLSETNDKYINVIEILLKLYENNSTYIQYLSNFPNDQGYKAIDIATPKCKYLLLKYLYYYGRYEIISKSSSEITHQSEYSIIQLAIDHDDSSLNLLNTTTNNNSNNNNKIVILKLMKGRDLFDYEINIRNILNFDNKYILPILHSHDSDNDSIYKQETLYKGFNDYPYCIVMNSGDNDLLNIIIHEHLNYKNIRLLFIEILEAVDHLHHKGYIHGDLRPLNIIRENNRLKLIDLSHCISYTNHEIFGTQSFFKHYPINQFQPPELISIVHRPNSAHRQTNAITRQSMRISTIKFKNSNDEIKKHTIMNTIINEEEVDDDNDNETNVQYNNINPIDHFNDQQHTANALIKVDISIDMWALGCILYFMYTNEYLIPSRYDNDEIDHNYITLLKEWPTNYKLQKLSKIKDIYCYNLLNRLLSKEIHRRPSNIQEVMKHPYISNELPLGRFAEMEAEYDFYISYRWKKYMLDYISKEKRKSPSKRQRRLSTVAVKSPVENKNENENDHMMYMHDDDKHSERLQELLIKKGFKVIKSKYESFDDNKYDYDDNFINNAINMIKSKAVIIVLSRYGINDCIDNSSLEHITNDHDIHQLLFEMRLAIELRNMGLLLSEIFVVLVGDVKSYHIDNHHYYHQMDLLENISNELGYMNDMNHTDNLKNEKKILPIKYKDSNDMNIDDVEYNMYYEEFDGVAVGRFGSCHPDSFPTNSIRKIEDLIKYVLELNQLGQPTVHDMSVYDIVEDIISYENYMIVGKGHEVFHNVADDIIEKFYDIIDTDNQNKLNQLHDKSYVIQEDSSRKSPSNATNSLPIFNSNNIPHIHHRIRRKSQVLSAALSKLPHDNISNEHEDFQTDKEKALYDEVQLLKKEIQQIRLQLK